MTTETPADKRPGKAFLLATEDGWDSAHILPKPGSQVLAMCGRRPVIVWSRVWTEICAATQDVPACARCRAVLETSKSLARPARAIIVDDNSTDRAYVRAIVKGLGDEIQIEETESARGAQSLLEAGPFDLVVCDYHLMGPETGVDVLAKARGLNPGSRRLLLTGDRSQYVREQALQDDVAHQVAIKTEGPGKLRSTLLALVRAPAATQRTR